MTDLVAVQACEERLVNCWPALDTLVMDGWAVRFANGYSGRANSASAIRPGATLDDAMLAVITGLFRAKGLAPAVRVTPLADPSVEARLAGACWQVVTRSIGMIGAPRAAAADSAVHLAQQPGDAWIDGVTAWQEASKRNPAHLGAIVRRILMPAVFASLEEEGRTLAYGMCVLDRGMAELGSIVVSPEARGKGLGRRLVGSLSAWARAQGARRIFLQVEASNGVARNLYRSIGLSELYGYTEYRLLPAA